MGGLMSELTSCDCHFIRCIKPNEVKQKNLFVPSLALQQIRYLGVMESIKVRKESFPIRKFYRHFFKRYNEICDGNKTYLFHELKESDFKNETIKFLY